MGGQSERDLVAAGREGDKNAYADLVCQYYKSVLGICLGVLGNRHDAEDAAQDAFVAGLRHLEQLRNGQGFGPWISQIARNRCIDGLRRRGRSRKMPAEEPVTVPSDRGNTEDLAGAIRRLPLELRLPLTMYYFDGRSAERIARGLGISHTTVCQRLRSARQELHRMLTEQGNV